MSEEPGSPVSAWTSSPRPLSWGRQGALNSASSAGSAETTLGKGARAASGGVASDNRKQSRLVGPFTEWSLQSAKQSSVTTSNSRKGLQPPTSHGTKLKSRPAAQTSAAIQQAATETGTLSSSTATAGKQQRVHPDGYSNRSSSRPALKQAAATVAAAEAAVSAAAAVLERSGKPQQQAAPRQHKQQQQGQGVNKGSPKGGSATAANLPTARVEADGLGSLRHDPQLAGAHKDQPVGMSPGPLQVLGVKARQQNEQQFNSATGVTHSRPLAGEPEAYAGTAGSPNSSTAGGWPGRAGQEQVNYGAAYADIDILQQSPAVVTAAQALVKRLRIQQRSRQGPPAFQRAAVPRPASPPPKVLNGAVLMSSCPEAILPSDLTAADLSSADISSIYTPVEAHAAQPLGMQQGPAWSEFTQLTVLDLSDNRLSSIAGLAWLPALVQLAVSANRLRSLQSISQVLEYQPQSDAAAAGDVHGSGVEFLNTTGSERSQRGVLHTAAGVQSSSSSHGSQQHSREGTAAEVPAGEGDGNTVSQPVQPTPESSPESPASSRRCTADFTLGAAAVDLPPWSLKTALRPAVAVCPDGFSQLEVLDVSYNMLSADEIMGPASPLSRLPRLQQLLAAGNGLSVLPAQSGPFTCLTQLDLSHNKLTGAALSPLGQLPVLLHLLMSHNPIKAVPDMAVEQDVNSSSSGAAMSAEGVGSSFPQLSELDLSYSQAADVESLMPLLQLPKLCVLVLVGTPLADQHRAGTILPGLHREGSTIITHQEEPTAVWQHSSRQKPSQRSKHRQQQGLIGTGRVLPVTVAEDMTPGHVLAAAGRNVIVGLQHQQLVAAFERVGDGIDNWQLAPVEEESSTALQLAAAEDEVNEIEQQQRSNNQGARSEGNDEAIVDQTFLTGVGITGDLPEGDEDEVAPVVETDEFQDPTERVALALGMKVTQLAHYTHNNPRITSGAIHKLRHALAHPLVDPEAGERAQQHHAAMTATAMAKQRPRQLLPLPQPIPTALDTREVAVQGIGNMLQDMRGRLQFLEGSLLQQLQSQANKLSAASQQMAASAAAEAEASPEQYAP